MDKEFIAGMLKEAGTEIDISQITLAREIWDKLEDKERFADVVIAHCREHCAPLLPDGNLTILLIADDGTILPQLPEHQPAQ